MSTPTSNDKAMNRFRSQAPVPEDGYFRYTGLSKNYLRLLKRYKHMIFIITGIVSVAMICYSLTARPVYLAATTILIRTERQSVKEIFGTPGTTGGRTLNNQIEYLKSRSLSEQVVSSLLEMEFADSLCLLNTEGDPRGAGLKEFITRQVRAVQSFTGDDAVQRNAIPAFGERVREAAKKLRDWLSFEPVPETDFIVIEVQAPDPEEAALIANTVAAEYYRQNMTLARGEVNEVKEFLRDQLENVRNNLFEAETALMKYQQQSQAVAMDDATTLLVEQVSAFESRHHQVHIELQAIETRIAHLKQQLNQRRKDALTEVTDVSSPFVQVLRDSLARKQVQLIMLETKGSVPSNHPAIRNVKKRITELENRLKSQTRQLIDQGIRLSDPVGYSQDLLGSILNMESKKAALKAREQYLDRIVQQYNLQVEALPEKSFRLARLTRNQQVNEKLFILMKTKYEETRIREAGLVGSVQIIDRAIPPHAPVKPDKLRNIILGALLGAISGIGLALAMDYLDNSLRTIEDVEVLGLNILGMIPAIRGTRSMQNGRERKHRYSKEVKAIESRLLINYESRSAVAEAYRNVRMNLRYLNLDRPMKHILVTSSMPGEGKTTTAVNLSITLAQMGHTTLLIDADLRKPMINKIFGYPRSPGLTDILVGEESGEWTVRDSKIKNLDLLLCGGLPPNPSQLLDSGVMKELIGQFGNRYDRIVYDSPPVIALTDAVILCAEVDATLLVVSSGQTDVSSVKRATGQLQVIGGGLAGAVLNNVSSRDAGSSYYYYYSSYSYEKDSIHSPFSESTVPDFT